MMKDGNELLASMQPVAQEADRRSLGPEVPKGIHHSELPEAPPDDVLAAEWNTYRHEVGRLLAEGHEGKFVLIKGATIVGFFDSWQAARQEGVRRYLLQPMLVQEIRTYEPILRIRGFNLPWLHSLSQSPKPG
jgi:hypothetical protein